MAGTAALLAAPSQQDAAEFLGHLLLQSQPGAFHGYWAAKLIVGPASCRRLDVVDRGHLTSPIILDATAGDFSSGVQAWQMQYSIHALQEPSSFLVIQLRRFAQHEGAYTKLRDAFHIQAGELVEMPVFSDGLRLTRVRYCVRAVIFHLGTTPYSGPERGLHGYGKSEMGFSCCR